MTTIVIGLAAVVVLILVVVLLALRYLRADDGDDFEDMPDERPQPRGSADDRDRRAAGRRPARSAWPPELAGNAGQRRTGERASQRPGRDSDRAGSYAAREHADARSGQGAAAKYDDPHRSEGAAKRHQDALPAVRPRPVRGKRTENDGAWPSTKWDELSDVDYWAEVASDKPLTTTAQPAAQARAARPGQARDAQARQGQGSSAGAASGRGAAPAPAPRLPVRGPRQPAAAGLSAAAAGPGGFVPAPHPPVMAQPESVRRPVAASAGDPGPATLARRDSMPVSAARLPPVSDDDPLTSPSFPKIPAADSRSYGGGRADTPPSGSRSPAPYTAATQQFPTYRSPSGQFDGYDAAARQSTGPVSGPSGGFGQPGSQAAGQAGPPPYRPAPSPDRGSYGGRPEPAGLPASPDGYQAGYLPPAASPRPAPAAAQGAPSGNPYGSYVSAPPSSYLPSSPADPPDSGLPAGYGGHATDSGTLQGSSYPQPTASAEASAGTGGPAGGWQPEIAAPARPAVSYQDVSYQDVSYQDVSYQDVSRQDVSRQLPSTGIPAADYLNGSGHTERAGYPAAQHEPAGYLPVGYPVGPQEPAGYTGPDPYGRDPYGRDPYGRDRDPHGGYPGYGPAGR